MRKGRVYRGGAGSALQRSRGPGAAANESRRNRAHWPALLACAARSPAVITAVVALSQMIDVGPEQRGRARSLALGLGSLLGGIERSTMARRGRGHRAGPCAPGAARRWHWARSWARGPALLVSIELVSVAEGIELVEPGSTMARLLVASPGAP